MTGASIVGWGETEAFGELEGKDYLDLNREAAYDALDRAGLAPKDIDGLLTTAPMDAESPLTYDERLAEELDLTRGGLNYAGLDGIGGASYVQDLGVAASLVADGTCESVLIVAADTLAGRGRQETVDDFAAVLDPDFEQPYDAFLPAMYALAARKHMDVYGTTEEQLAGVAEIAYRHAAMQPRERVYMNEEKTVEDILDSSMVADPLTRDQCSLITDGGGAVIVTDSDYAHKAYDTAVDILGVGTRVTHDSITQMPDLTRTGAAAAGREAFEAAEVGHDDLDVVEIYDCFTNVPITVLEDLGFCRKGEGGSLVESGDLELGGSWPMNTHGGLLAQSHHGSGGLIHITEAVRQLRDEAGKTQIDGADTALVHGNGGVMSSQSVAILERGR